MGFFDPNYLKCSNNFAANCTYEFPDEIMRVWGKRNGKSNWSIIFLIKKLPLFVREKMNIRITLWSLGIYLNSLVILGWVYI